jgi:hypothetical protein
VDGESVELNTTSGNAQYERLETTRQVLADRR